MSGNESIHHKWWRINSATTISKTRDDSTEGDYQNAMLTLKVTEGLFSDEELTYLANFFKWQWNYKPELTPFYHYMIKRREELIKLWIED